MAKKPQADSQASADVTVEIIVDNVSSSVGVHVLGDKPSIPAADAAILVANGQAKKA
jgi:hypothetical protein